MAPTASSTPNKPTPPTQKTQPPQRAPTAAKSASAPTVAPSSKAPLTKDEALTFPPVPDSVAKSIYSQAVAAPTGASSSSSASVPASRASTGGKVGQVAGKSDMTTQVANGVISNLMPAVKA